MDSPKKVLNVKGLAIAKKGLACAKQFWRLCVRYHGVCVSDVMSRNVKTAADFSYTGIANPTLQSISLVNSVMDSPVKFSPEFMGGFHQDKY